MDGAGEATAGQRLREIRAWRGLSLRVVAELAGISAIHLSRLERGLWPVDKRSMLEALATALRVAPSEITGQPYPPSDHQQAEGHAAAPALRAVLRDIELGEPTWSGEPRSMAELGPEVAAVSAAYEACDYPALQGTVPSLIAELHAVGTGESNYLLARVLHAAFYLAKDLGHADLAWMVAGRLYATAQAIGEPQWVGMAEFVRAHGVIGERSRQRALSLTERAAERITPTEGEAGHVYGNLHLSAALHAAALRRPDEASAHLAEAAEIAKVTGDGVFAGLHFGPRNVGIWRVALAVELGEGGRVGELARAVDVAAIPSARRKARFYADLGRGLATERSTREQAVAALGRAEQLTPQRIRTDPFVRETVTDLLGRARREAGGRELRGLAYRMGIAV